MMLKIQSAASTGIRCDCGAHIGDSPTSPDGLHRVIDQARDHVTRGHHFERVFLLAADRSPDGYISVTLADRGPRNVTTVATERRA